MSTLTNLTAAQLTVAAADLRNAALVVTYAGYTKGRMVDHLTGTVCALGAIELATARQLLHDEHGYDLSRAVSDSGMYRAQNAAAVFADFVPSGLCDMCDDDRIEEHNKTCGLTRCTQPREPYDKVTHYNDVHCISGSLLINLLGLAAGGALLALNDRRSMLSGDRIPAPVAGSPILVSA